MEIATAIGTLKIIKATISVSKKGLKLFKDKRIVNKIESVVNSNFSYLSEPNIDKLAAKNYKKCLKEYEQINPNNYYPSLKDVINSSLDLTFEELNITVDEKVEKKYDLVFDEILEEIGKIDCEFLTQYREDMKGNKLLEIVSSQQEILNTLNFKNKVKTIDDEVRILNSQKKCENNIELDLFNYYDENFERLILDRVLSNDFLMISGPSIEEAKYYLLYIMQKNNKKNVYIVPDSKIWTELQTAYKTNYYSNIIFIADFSEIIEPIPETTSIQLLSNDDCIDDEEVIKFRNRTKEQTVNLLKNYSTESINQLYKLIGQQKNQYSIYKSEVFKSLVAVKKIKVSDELLKLALIGSWNHIENSKDLENINKFFQIENWDETLEKVREQGYLFERNTTYSKHIINKEKILKSKKNRFNKTIIESFIEYAKFVIIDYLNPTFESEFSIESISTTSTKAYNSIYTTLNLILKVDENLAREISQKIYIKIVGEINGNVNEQLIIVAYLERITFINPDLVYENISKIIKSKNINEKLLESDNFNYFQSSYSHLILHILRNLLYHTIYSIESFELVIDMYRIEEEKKKRKSKYKDLIVQYMNYQSNDFPVKDERKLEYLKENNDTDIFELIIEGIFRTRTWLCLEIEEASGFKQVKRKRLREEDANYLISLIQNYIQNSNTINGKILMEPLVFYYLSDGDDSLMDLIVERIDSDKEIAKTVNAIREKLNGHIKYTGWKLDDRSYKNAYALLKQLEKKYSQEIFKYIYLISSDLHFSLIIDENMTQANEELLLQEEKNKLENRITSLEAKELLNLFFEINTNYIADPEYVYRLIQKAKFSFEEVLELLLNVNELNMESLIPFIIANKFLEDDVNKKKLVKEMKNKIKGMNEVGWYFQRVEFDIEFLRELEEEELQSILKYQHISKYKSQLKEYFQLLKENGMIKKCFEILWIKKDFAFEELDYIKEAVELLQIPNNGSKFEVYDLEEVFKYCNKYYEENFTDENKKLLLQLSLSSMGIFDNDFKVLNEELYDNLDYLFSFVKYYYLNDNKERESSIDDISIVGYYKFFESMHLNFKSKSVEQINEWMNEAYEYFQKGGYKKAFLDISGKIIANSFEEFDDILFSLNTEEILQDKDFISSFTIRYSNTLGVLRGEIPQPLKNRYKLFVNLKKRAEEEERCYLYKILEANIKDYSRQVAYHEESARY